MRADAGCPRAEVGGTGAPEPTLFDDCSGARGGEPTLDELVSGVWEGLAAHQRVPCPVCGGEMAPGYGAHSKVVAGGCTSCGTRTP